MEGLAIAVIDKDLRINACSNAFCQMVDYSCDELKKRSILDLTHKDDRARSKQNIDSLFGGRLDKYTIIKRYVKKDGDPIWVELTVGPVRSKEGKISALYSVAKDITEVQRTRIELSEQSVLLETILNSIPDVIGIQDPDHRMIRYNEAGYKWLGMTREEIQGKHCYELIGGKNPCDICATTKTYSSKKPEMIQRYEPSLDSWLDVRSYPILDKNGDIHYVVEHLRDISDIKHTEEELRTTRQMYKDTLNTLKESVNVVNTDMEIELVNDSYRELLKSAGISEEPVGVNLFDLQPFLPDKVFQEYQEVIRTGMPLHTEEIVEIDGKTFFTETTKLPLKTGEQLEKVITVIRDVTDRYNFQRVIKDEKEKAEFYLDLLGHDLGNMHQGIAGTLELIDQHRNDKNMVQDLLGLASSTVKKSVDLTQSIMLFSKIRSGPPKIVDIDLGIVVRESLIRIEEIFPEKNIEMEIDVDSYRVKAEPLISELLFNLMHNSVRLQGDDPWIGIHAREEMDMIRLEISDKGPGIPGSMKTQLFMRYGIKNEKTRTGLGLSIVKALVDRYGGGIKVEDRIKGDPKQGVIFIIDLPKGDS